MDAGAVGRPAGGAEGRAAHREGDSAAGGGLKPWQRKQWCIATIDGEYLPRMEDVLDLYERAYDAGQPVVCFDERPCQLLGDLKEPIPMKPGSAKKIDYHYKRNGTCSALVACEPMRGWRKVIPSEQRRKRDYALFMKELVEREYPKAEKVIVIQDNLNTHTAGAFYESFDAETARRLVRKLEFHFTPKKASWLNMAEVEISALGKQCLDRRIGSREELEREIAGWVEYRNRRRVKIQWRFTTTQARTKLSRHYDATRN
jgi:hypothetical protein